MSDHPPTHTPRAVVRSQLDRRRRLSLIWAIPIVSALIGAWLAWRTFEERGPLITISFESASGLTAGQSHVRHKDVDMGLVEKIALSKDLQRVVVTVRMNREADALADRQGAVLDRQAALLRRRAERVGDAGVRQLHRAAALRGRRSAGDPFHRAGDAAGADLRRARPHLPADRVAPGQYHAGLAGVFPRPGCRRGAGLGSRQHGRDRHRACLRAGALRPVRARQLAVLERFRGEGVARPERPAIAGGLVARRVAGRHRLRHARARGAASRPARKTTSSRSTTARTPRMPPPSRAACISWRISRARSPGWRQPPR